MASPIILSYEPEHDTVSTAADLYYETRDATWGTVVEIAPTVIPLDYVPIEVKAGVTIRCDHDGGNAAGHRGIHARSAEGDIAQRTGCILDQQFRMVDRKGTPRRRWSNQGPAGRDDVRFCETVEPGRAA